MSGLDGAFEAAVDLTFVERALNTLRRPDLRPAWKEARKPLREDIKAHRKAQEGPGGSWPGRSPLTARRAGAKRKRRPRKLLGKLPTALQTKSDRARVAMISRVRWSAVHQDGGTAGHGARIPARPFLWASDGVLKAIAGIVSAHLAKLFAKGA